MAGGDAKCPPLWRKIWLYPAKLYLANPPLGVYPEGIPPPIVKYTCARLFIAAQFTIGRARD